MSVLASTSPVKKNPQEIIARPAQETANGADALLAQAVASGANIDTLERLMALRKEMLAEKAKEAFNTAMAAFQAECPVIKKTKSVHTKAGKKAYCYAPIESVVEQVKELLQKHGFRYLVTMEFLKEPDGGSTVKAICHVVHKIGHEEISSFEVPLGIKTDIMSASQVVAAASTFAKRYAFLNAFGIITGDEDTDAAKLDDPPTPGYLSTVSYGMAGVMERPVKAKVVVPPMPKPPADPLKGDLSTHATAGQVTEIAKLCKELGGDVGKLYDKFKIEGQPTRKQAMDMLDALRKKVSKNSINALTDTDDLIDEQDRKSERVERAYEAHTQSLAERGI